MNWRDVRVGISGLGTLVHADERAIRLAEANPEEPTTIERIGHHGRLETDQQATNGNRHRPIVRPILYSQQERTVVTPQMSSTPMRVDDPHTSSPDFSDSPARS